ncbi:MAG: family 16 glycosylhydrolase, partial [Gammaproteobacteria bacterium]
MFCRTESHATESSNRRSCRSALAALAAIGAFGIAGCGGTESSVPGGEYTPPVVEFQVVFEDEFEGTELDLSKWNIDEGDGCPDLCGWGNNEAQVYSADNITVGGGVLTIEGRQEADGTFTSGRINTKGKFDFQYGRVEVRARLPEGQGTWPGIWLLHSDPDVYGPWPASGEIDIVESFNLGVDGNTATRSAMHYGLPTPPFSGTSSVFDNDVSPAMDFRTYAVEWERDRVRFFVDGEHFQTQNSENWYAYFPADDVEGFYDPFGAFKEGPVDAPFDQLFHLIINFALGGNPVGDVDPNALPQVLEIDSVRVYECVNANPGTGRGCGTGSPDVIPLEDNDGNELADVETAQPFVEELDLYVDGPESISLEALGEVYTNNLSAITPFQSDTATVINDPLFEDPEDAGNTVWRVGVAGGVANVALTGEEFTDNPLLETGFDFSGGRRGGGPGTEPVGEIAFEMEIVSITPGTELVIRLDSGFPNAGDVILPDSVLAPVGERRTYSVKFDDFLANPAFVDLGGTGADLANVVFPFVLEVRGGDAEVLIDNVRATNACKVVGGCGVELKNKGFPDLVVYDDAVNVDPWNRGIVASDEGTGFTDYTDGNTANKVNWAEVASDDPERGQVVEVTFNDSNVSGVWFIASAGGVDTTEYAAGAVRFDIKVLDYGNAPGMTFKIDCFVPCTSGDKALGKVGDGDWETVTFPVSQLVSSGLDLEAVNTGIVLFPTFGQQTGGITFRVDDVRWIAEAEVQLAQIDLPVTFDEEGVDYSLENFGGAGTELVTDPTDPENTVASTTKGEGAETFAGTVIGTGAGFANPIPFEEGATTMSVRVYSPNPGVPVLLKVENEDPYIAAAEVLANTTVANEWETLTFDFSTVGINLAETYVRAII